MNEKTFDLCIQSDTWDTIKPRIIVYKGREYFKLKPGLWADVMGDEFWRQYRMPCAFSFKNNVVSLNPEEAYLTVSGKCKDSINCGNTFIGILDKEPVQGLNVWIKVKCKDTRFDNHTKIKRQLRNEKRQLIGEQVAKNGAADSRRKLAVKEQNLGDIEAPIVYSSNVLRKLAQETNDKAIGVNKLDGNNPVDI